MSMNTIKTYIIAGVVISSMALKAHDRSEAHWLMRADACAEENIIITEHFDLKVKNFTVKDERGKNIYQIALDKHKQTGSIRCARLALFLEVEEQKLRKKSEDKIKVLDEVEKTFENPHQ